MDASSKCKICSTNAQSWRYGALACNVCANFFRRNLLKREQMLCSSGGSLEIRQCFDERRCRMCRLKLCMLAGMSEKLVLHNAECRRLAKERRTGMKEVIPIEEKQIIVHNPLSPELVIDRVMANLQRIETAFDRLRKSRFNPMPWSVSSLSDALSGPSKLSIDYGEMQWAKGYPEGYTNNEGCPATNLLRRIRIGIERTNYEANRKSWHFSNMIFAIEYFKAFDVFAQLSTQTRRVLAGKMAFLCSNLTNLLFSIQQGKSYLVFPDGIAAFGGMQTGFPELVERTVNWHRYVNDLRLDGNECALLKVLLILSPSLDDASKSEHALLTSHSESYAKILFSYVLARRGREQGPRCYQEMLSLIETINHRVKIEKDLQILAIELFREKCPLLAEIISI